MNKTPSPTHEPLRSAVLQALDAGRIKAISLDLDDTLWPIWPTIERAEAAIEGAPDHDRESVADAVLDHARAVLVALASGDDGAALVGGPIAPNRDALAALWRITADAVASGDGRG